MNIPVEVLLVLGVLGFYLYDSACLLYRNEVIFSECDQEWRATIGSSLLMRGRYLFMPNPLTPYVVVFRLHWRMDGRREEAEQLVCVRHFLCALWPVRAGCMVVWTLLLVVLPTLLFKNASSMVLVALLVSVYVSILIMVLWIYRHRKVMELSGRQVFLLALDGLACPPNAINLARKVAMRRSTKGDAFSIADLVLRGSPRTQFRLDLEERIAVTADFAEQGSAEMIGMEVNRQRLQELMS